MPRVLLVGGLDPSGGAGLTVDATVTMACGAQPLPIAIALTTQGRRGFRELHPVDERQWRGALQLQLADAPVAAVKVGLVGSIAALRALTAELVALPRSVPIVVDPVLSATTGGLAAEPGFAAVCRETLLPLAALCTPNVPEFEELFGGDVERAFAAGCRALLCKGGHADGAVAVDSLLRPQGAQHWRRPRWQVGAVRGTGCALASAIAAHLAGGLELAAACERAGDELAQLLAAMGAPPTDALPRCLPLWQWPSAARP